MSWKDGQTHLKLMRAKSCRSCHRTNCCIIKTNRLDVILGKESWLSMVGCYSWQFFCRLLVLSPSGRVSFCLSGIQILVLVQSLLSWHDVPWYRVCLLAWVHALSLVKVSDVSKSWTALFPSTESIILLTESRLSPHHFGMQPSELEVRKGACLVL